LAVENDATCHRYNYVASVQNNDGDFELGKSNSLRQMKEGEGTLYEIV